MRGNTHERGGAHNGVDFGGGFGAPVLAAAEGTVTRAGTIGPKCGTGVYIKHEFGLHTVYCHLSTVHVVPGATIERGQTIGAIGVSGNWGDRTHVHFMLGSQGEYDPMKYIVGCYEPGVKYPTDKIVLTYPVKCRNKL
jgi:murein DD-endopeptidase MepM/ murein hydrolase activator NlpD